MPTATIFEIKELFVQSRFPTGWQLLTVILYFPLGSVLALLRFFIGLHAFVVSCILPKMSTVRSIVLRCMCSVLGVIVTRDGTENQMKSARVLVCNHVTPLDHLAVDLVMANIMPSVWDIPELLNWALGYEDLGVKQGRDVLIKNAKKHCSESNVPILSYPEGASTSGKRGLLKFSTWPFSLEQPVQPVVITVRRLPLVAITPSPIGSRWWTDLMWFAFVPYTKFHLRILPVQVKENTESIDDFAVRVQHLMAQELHIVPTKHTSADKVEYVKRHFDTSDASPVPLRQKQKEQLLYMSDPLFNKCQQVKEVLPLVPIEIIRRDLANTRCVDETITNILEGRVTYTPELPATSKAQLSSWSTKTPTKDQKTMWATSSKDRMKSYQERKAEFIAEAKHKYMEKHGI
ncbi:PREDICTED: ancient ubiquitous protein 1-like [Priapulus caudatus]|uniref:Lipid droplet-regulating VLDL assembly factor AUP1 n=1 Tax=Priapulus caudatus TaxID=37621 RepID=A0ABM1EAJ1_PRICU|nr:PREDICTED: ancient ubiquitous protein 1-like [Priapulus caudatus]